MSQKSSNFHKKFLDRGSIFLNIHLKFTRSFKVYIAFLRLDSIFQTLLKNWLKFSEFSRRKSSQKLFQSWIFTEALCCTQLSFKIWKQHKSFLTVDSICMRSSLQSSNFCKFSFGTHKQVKIHKSFLKLVSIFPNFLSRLEFKTCSKTCHTQALKVHKSFKRRNKNAAHNSFSRIKFSPWKHKTLKARRSQPQNFVKFPIQKKILLIPLGKRHVRRNVQSTCGNIWLTTSWRIGSRSTQIGHRIFNRISARNP